MEAKGKQGKFHREKLLLYTPSFRNSTGEASCELKTMDLAGQHIAHKTIKQPNWIWSTFEHKLNAPDCTALPDSGNEQGDDGPSTACPTTIDTNYSFFPKSCSEGGSNEAACQTCNVGPLSNLPANAMPEECTNPDAPEGKDTPWCLDLGPAADAGITKACRQFPIEDNYPSAHAWNEACADALGSRSVWSNYQLVSTQWFVGESVRCETGSTNPARTMLQPQVDVSATADMDATTRPFLGNTSMEAYVRSNCTGCHSAATISGESDSPSTDLMYWLSLEVAQPGDSDG